MQRGNNFISISTGRNVAGDKFFFLVPLDQGRGSSIFGQRTHPRREEKIQIPKCHVFVSRVTYAMPVVQQLDPAFMAMLPEKARWIVTPSTSSGTRHFQNHVRKSCKI